MDELEAIEPADDGTGGEVQAARAGGPRWSRRTKIGASALAAAAVAAGGWAVGSATQSSSSTIKIQPAAASSAALGQTSGTAGGRRRMFRGALLGTVENLSGSTFQVTPTAAPGAAAALAPVSVTMTGSTTYSQVSSTTGLVKNLSTGTVISATGTRDSSTGNLDTTTVTERPSGSPARRTPPAGAAGVANRGPFAVGTVTADSSGGVITITTPGGGTETLVTSSTTTELTQATIPPSDVVNGARVQVQGTPSTSGGTTTVTATHITVIPSGVSLPGPALAGPGGLTGPAGPGGPGGPGGLGGPGPWSGPNGMQRRGVRGTVANLSGSTFQVNPAAAPTAPGAAAALAPAAVTVTTTGSTTYSQVSSTSGPITTLSPGTVITAIGTRDSTTGDLAAKTVDVRPSGSPALPAARAGAAAVANRGPFAVGTVTADSGGVITITTPGGGTETITTSSTTTELTQATISGVADGAQVVVQGTPSTSGGTTTITATHVTVIPSGLSLGALGLAGPGGFGGFGGPGWGGRLGGPGPGTGTSTSGATTSGATV